jgi:hypothetical protein
MSVVVLSRTRLDCVQDTVIRCWKSPPDVSPCLLAQVINSKFPAISTQTLVLSLQMASTGVRQTVPTDISGEERMQTPGQPARHAVVTNIGRASTQATSQMVSNLADQSLKLVRGIQPRGCTGELQLGAGIIGTVLLLYGCACQQFCFCLITS